MGSQPGTFQFSDCALNPLLSLHYPWKCSSSSKKEKYLPDTFLISYRCSTQVNRKQQESNSSKPGWLANWLSCCCFIQKVFLMQLIFEKTFQASGSRHTYWLAHCLGKLLKGCSLSRVSLRLSSLKSRELPNTLKALALLDEQLEPPPFPFSTFSELWCCLSQSKSLKQIIHQTQLVCWCFIAFIVFWVIYKLSTTALEVPYSAM